MTIAHPYNLQTYILFFFFFILTVMLRMRMENIILIHIYIQELGSISHFKVELRIVTVLSKRVLGSDHNNTVISDTHTFDAGGMDKIYRVYIKFCVFLTNILEYILDCCPVGVETSLYTAFLLLVPVFGGRAKNRERIDKGSDCQLDR